MYMMVVITATLLLSVGLKTVDDVNNKINELDSLKVDFLKAYEMLTPEQFKEVTKLAKEKGTKSNWPCTIKYGCNWCLQCRIKQYGTF